VGKNTRPVPVSIRVRYKCHLRIKNHPRTHIHRVRYPYPNYHPYSTPLKHHFFYLRGPSERYHHQGFRSAGQSHNYRAWAWPLTVEPGGLGRSMPLHSGERDVLVNFRGARHTHTVPSQPVESAPRIPNTTPPGRLALATRTPHRCVWSPNSSLTSKNLNAVGHRDADCCPVAFSQGPLLNGLHLLTARPVPAPAYSISKKKAPPPPLWRCLPVPYQGHNTKAGRSPPSGSTNTAEPKSPFATAVQPSDDT
jgi:hypothetical protein